MGLSQFKPAPVRTALDQQCDTVRSAFPDDVIRCVSAHEYVQEVKKACADEKVGTSLDDFWLGKPGTSKIIHPRCPPP